VAGGFKPTSDPSGHERVLRYGTQRRKDAKEKRAEPGREAGIIDCLVLKKVDSFFNNPDLG
jgi:hypothetical protein